MGIWEFLASKAESVKRNALDSTPAKNACRNSLNFRSATFAKIDHAVRRVAHRIAAHEISTKELGTYGAVPQADSTKNCRKSCCANGYGFTTFAKIGYTVRVKGVYRIIHWIKKDGTKSMTAMYAINFAENAELHESQDDNEFIPGYALAMPTKRECMESYTFGFITFARIGYVVRVNVNKFGHWMADDNTKSTLVMYSSLLARNALRCVLLDFYTLIPGGIGVALLIILCNTLIDIIHEHKKLSKEKGEKFNINDLNEKGLYAMKELLIFVVNEVIEFMMEEPFRAQLFCKGVLSMESAVLIVRELLAFVMKRHFGTQLFNQTDEIVLAIIQALSGSGSAGVCGRRKKKKGKGAF